MRRFRWDKQYLYWGVTAFLVIAAAIVFYLIVNNLGWLGAAIKSLFRILSPFIWGLVIAYLLYPLLRIYNRSLFTPLFTVLLKKHPRKETLVPKLSRGFGVMLCVISIIVLLAGIVMLVAPQLYSSIERLVVNSENYISRADELIHTVLQDYPEVDQTISSTIGDLNDGIVSWATNNLLPEMKGLLGNVASNLYSILKGIYNVIIGIVVSVYVLYDKEGFSARCKKLVYCIFSLEAADRILESVRFVNQVFMSYISGKILDSLIVGLICYTGCLIMRIPFAILVASIVAVSNLIPFFGPIIGGVIGTFFIVLEAPIKALMFIIFILLLQQFDGNVLGPKILGSSVGIKGFWIMFSIILGAGMFSFAGMLLGVPVFVVIYAFVQGLVNRKLERSGLPIEQAAYENMDHIDPRTGLPIERQEPQTPLKQPKRGRKAKKEEPKDKEK